MRLAGYRAIESLRLEAGYRVWGRDVAPDINPFEAGLGFAVKLDKPQGFPGKDALARIRERALSRRLRLFSFDAADAPGPPVHGGEAIYRNGNRGEPATSAGRSLDQYIVYALVDEEGGGGDGDEFTVDRAGLQTVLTPFLPVSKRC